MTTMTAFEAKCAFGQFLDATLREPVTITQNGRNFGVMFAQHDLEAMALAFLSPAMLARLRAGRITPTCTEGEHFCGIPVWRHFPAVERRI